LIKVYLILILVIIQLNIEDVHLWKSKNLYRHELEKHGFKPAYTTGPYSTAATVSSFGQCLRECTKSRTCISGQYHNISSGCFLFRLTPTWSSIDFTTNRVHIVFYRGEHVFSCF
jgi:hypothetical protein